MRLVWIEPILRMKSLRGLFRTLTNPLAGLPIFTVTIWFWHAPVPYDWALRSPACHYLEHACFLGAGLIFWFPVVRPYPSRPTWSLWLLVPYLILADVQNTLLSALLTFADRPLYAWYAQCLRSAAFRRGTIRRRQALSCGCRDRSRISFRSSPLAFGFCFRPAPEGRESRRKKAAHPPACAPSFPCCSPLRHPQASIFCTSLGWAAFYVGAMPAWRYSFPLALGAVALIFDGLRGPSRRR